MNTEAQAATRWNPWPVSIITFFAIAILSSVGFVAFCSRHPADLVAADYYEQEVQYQGRIDRLQRAQQAGRQASATYDSQTRQIQILLGGIPAGATATGSIQLYRPSAMAQDRQIALALDATGGQRIDASQMLPGLWKVRVAWKADRQDYFLDQKLVIGPAAGAAGGAAR
jgi:nitrogen fixation protein FixH